MLNFEKLMSSWTITHFERFQVLDTANTENNRRQILLQNLTLTTNHLVTVSGFLLDSFINSGVTGLMRYVSTDNTESKSTVVTFSSTKLKIYTCDRVLWLFMGPCISETIRRILYTFYI